MKGDPVNTSAPKVEAVAALYAAERADLSGLDATTTNLIAITIAYITATIAFLPTGTTSGLDGWIVAAVPLPVVILACYWLTLLNVIAARALSARQLELLLHSHTWSALDSVPRSGSRPSRPS